jgi:hypothetical protein
MFVAKERSSVPSWFPKINFVSIAEGKVFIEPLSSNESLLRFHESVFPPSCHNAIYVFFRNFFL